MGGDGRWRKLQCDQAVVSDGLQRRFVMVTLCASVLYLTICGSLLSTSHRLPYWLRSNVTTPSRWCRCLAAVRRLCPASATTPADSYHEIVQDPPSSTLHPPRMSSGDVRYQMPARFIAISTCPHPQPIRLTQGRAQPVGKSRV